MTALHPGARAPSRAVLLGDAARADLHRLLERDPIVNAAVAARVHAAGSLHRRRLGGSVVAVDGAEGLAGACFSGGNLIPVGGDPGSWALLAEFVGRRPRDCSAIVGRADAVSALWERLQPRWGPARAVREQQPLLMLDRRPPAVPDEQVRPVAVRDVDRYLAAATAMFTEELGVSPHVSPGTSAFQARMYDLVARGRAFARVDFRGQVVFKAEIAVVSRHTCQIQGVWVRPDLRGRGIATGALATVIGHALELAPTASLYVNDFNVAALRLYDRLGMRRHATLSTVLLA